MQSQRHSRGGSWCKGTTVRWSTNQVSKSGNIIAWQAIHATIAWPGFAGWGVKVSPQPDGNDVANTDEYLKFIVVRQHVIFICLLTRALMTLAEALMLVKRENWRPLPWLAMAIALSGATLPAYGECVSPSAAAGATTTTIYRCPEGSSAGPQPTIVDPGNSTDVERGSADVPWFGPKPTRTADPLAAPNAVSQPNPPEDVAKTEPVPVTVDKPATSEAPPLAATPAEAPEKAPGAVEGNTAAASATPEIPPATKAPAAAAEVPAADKMPAATGGDEAAPKAAEAEPADADVSEPETTSAESKPVKAKATKAKHAKAKHKKLKLAKSKRAKAKLVEEKRGKAKAAKTTETETEAAATGKTAKTAKREPKSEQVTEPAKGDDKIILMTRKNMPLGSRIKNWLGL